MRSMKDEVRIGEFVIARSEATRQSRVSETFDLDCFAEARNDDVGRGI